MDEGILKQLAYTLQRIEEPGGRFTDRDIAMQMERLKSGNSSGGVSGILRQLAIQLARQEEPEGRLSEADIERAMAMIKSSMEGNMPSASMMKDTTTSAYGDAGNKREVPSFLREEARANGGRIGYQTGGVTEVRELPPEFIEAAGKTFLGDLATATGQVKTADLSKVFGPQFVAAQDPLQAQAQQIATQGLGAFQSGLAGQQAQLGAQQQALQGTDISRLGSLGALNQAQQQANLDATREAARQATFLPQEQLDRFASQVTGIMGGYPGQTQTTNIPNPTPLQTALGVGTTLAGLYTGFKPPVQRFQNVG